MTSSDQPPLFTKARRNRTFALGVAAGAALMLLRNFAIGATADNTQPPTQQPSTTTTAVDPGATSGADPTAEATRYPEIDADTARRIDGDPMSLGAADAPVVIVEYADYRCPFCSSFEQQSLPIIVEEYVDRGLVRVEFRDMPLFGQYSTDAAVAGRAAASQGKFWEFMNVVAAHGVEQGGHPDMPREQLVAFAQQAGVPDVDQFTSDLDDPELLAAVDADLLEGRQLGITAVPAFLVGNVPISGAQPIDIFRSVLAQELADAGIR